MNEAQALVARVCATCGARYPEDALFCPNDGAPLQSAAGAERDGNDPYLGQEIAGHIEIRQLVGIGAMGRVYRAFQRGIDRDVAVKILHRELSANAQLVSRFTREAKVASRLQHPNVVQVLLAGQLPDRALYMVMEFLDGLSLQSAILAAGGALPLSRALHITLQLCEAAGEAHQQGIVHRDLKPENVMLVRRGSDDDFAKVLDFGIARINWGEQSVATAAGLIFGTARYISPEGAQGHAVGPPSDVYSIATLLYQMLGGRTPFEGDQAVGLLVQQIHDAPPALKSIARAHYVPDALADVIMANLVKDPAKREPDARALGQSIVDAAKRAGLSADEISRPILRRPASAMQLASLERTRQHDLTPELTSRLSPTPGPVNGSAAVNGGAARPPTGATVKWEPPSEFQAKLAAGLSGAVAQGQTSGEATSSSPDLAAVRGRVSSSVDATMDDASAPPAPAGSAPSFPVLPSSSVSRTVAEDPRASTQYTPPVAAAMEPSAPVAAPPSRPSGPDTARSNRASRPSAGEPEESRSRGTLFIVALCFVVGVLGAALIAWRMGKLGGDADAERYVARATDAMYKNHFGAPPGENVRDLTDEALRRWPSDRRFADIRERAANELVAQAGSHRAPGEVQEALRLAKLALELDPKDASARRLVEQLEAEIATAPTSSAAPLPPSSAGPAVTPARPVSGGVPGARVVLEVAPDLPKPTQPAELTAKVTSKAALGDAAFVVAGPGLATPARVAAQGDGVVFKAAFGFPRAGRYEVAFTASDAGKTVRAARSVIVAEPARTPPPAGTQSPPATPPTPTASPPPTTLPPPASSGSVKWL